MGDRAGTFHAVDAKTGEAAWTFPTGAMILKPASFSPDGQQIVVGSEDMHVYCLSPAGKLLWKSPKLAGLSLRDGAPTVWEGRVIVRTNPSRPFHESLHEGQRVVCDIQRNIPVDEREDKVYPGLYKGQYFLRRTDRREKAENAGVVQYLKEHPHSRTWFTLNLADGREPWIAPRDVYRRSAQPAHAADVQPQDAGTLHHDRHRAGAVLRRREPGGHRHRPRRSADRLRHQRRSCDGRPRCPATSPA